MSQPHNQEGSEVHLWFRDPKAVRPCRAAYEVVDANIAQAELEAKAASKDVDVQEMLGVIKRRLK